MKRIGIYFGSFNPPHIGHVGVVNQALTYCDHVFVIPTIQNPWKHKHEVDFDLRYKMCVEAFKDLKNCTVWDIERHCEVPHYSYKTLDAINKLVNGELFIIGGADVAKSIKSWEKGEYILNTYGVFGVTRPGFDNGSIPIGPNLEISSTEVRKMIWSDRQLYPYVHPDVEKLINNYNLYK